ncbi:MAG: cupin domain-containing protein [Alphaproteobacteria bacterium]|nr:cupin domain-containing protein [Alphaproteobacteria bacterium]
MSLKVRRVVTGHDENGKAKVLIDEISDNVVSRRSGQNSTVIWATDRYPPDLGALDDISGTVQQTTLPGGSVFRISRLEPGVGPQMHRTESLDYAIVLSGEIDMELDDGATVHLTAGDVVVQRGTVHNWINNGTEACMMAYVLISAALPDGLEQSG